MNQNPVGMKTSTPSTQDVKHSTSTSGVLKGKQGSREIHTEAKPKGTLTFQDAPFKFFTTACLQFFSRVADRFHDENTQIYRRAERALQDPFAPPAEKKAAADALVKLDDQAFLVISFTKKMDAVKILSFDHYSRHWLKTLKISIFKRLGQAT
ncbi:MAG: hypothetical protein Tsb0018_04530 [Opitutales bacterium]